MSAVQIARALGRTTRWVRKWRRRSRTGEDSWYRDYSRAPQRQARQAPPEWETAVLDARRALTTRSEAGEHVFLGAIAVRQELDRRGVMLAGHSLRQIERIIQRNGLAEPRRSRSRRGPKRFYPGPQSTVRFPGELHEVDFVGPLYRRGGSRMTVLSRMDILSREAISWVLTQETSEVACSCLWTDWQRNGLPRYLQMDNQAPFIGGLNHPRSIGKVIRLCLYAGVQPVFIPPYTPFYNAHVESYQGLWQERVWERFDFTSGEEFQAELDRFASALAEYRAYGRQVRGDRQPEARPRSKVPAELPRPREVPLCWGHIHLIRRVADDGTVNILNEKFRVSHEFAHDYVWAAIDTQHEALTITHQAEPRGPARTILNLHYAFREEARRRPPLRGGERCVVGSGG